MTEASSSSVVSVIPRSPPGPQVFTSFRGKDVRKSFVSFLVPALKDKNINVFIDDQEERGKFLISLFERISESKLALVIFSEGYTESKWCLDELVKIKECVDQKKLIVIPIFYKLDPSKVKGLRGKFGDKFRDLAYRYRHEPERCRKWTEALTSVSQTFAMSLSKYSDKSDQDFISSIVMEVKKVVVNISKGLNGENDDSFMVPGRKLTMTAYEAPNLTADRVFIDEMITEVKRLLEYIKKKADQRGQLKTIQNIQSEAVQVIRQPEAVQIIPQPESVPNRQPEPVKIQQPKVNDQGFMFNARKLMINNSHNARHWTFVSISESPNEAAIEVAKMVICYDLKVWGEFHARELTFGKKYEVVFVVKVEDTMSRFDILAKTQLMVPEKELQEQELQFVDLIKNEWIEIPGGVFDAWPHKEKIAFYLYQDGSEQKMTGLMIKSAIIRPVKPEVVQIKQPKAIHIQQLIVNHQGSIFNARQLRINNSHNARHWTYVSISESPNEPTIEVAKMVICYDLEVCGEFHARELAPGRWYEVVFVVKIEDTMSRFDILAKAQLMVPDKELQEQELQFVDLIKSEWIEIRAGVFEAWPHKEKIAFYLYQYGSEQKMTGLLVKGAIIRPIN